MESEKRKETKMMCATAPLESLTHSEDPYIRRQAKRIMASRNDLSLLNRETIVPPCVGYIRAEPSEQQQKGEK